MGGNTSNAGGQAVAVDYQIKARGDSQAFFVDEKGRKNKSQAELVVNVVPNRPPELKLEWPGHDVDVSPLEELLVIAVKRCRLSSTSVAVTGRPAISTGLPDASMTRPATLKPGLSRSVTPLMSSPPTRRVVRTISPAVATGFS